MKRIGSKTVEGTRLVWPDRVPFEARYTETGRNDACVTGVFLYGSGKMQVAWSLEGAVLSECPFDRRGLRHGLELSRYEDGAVEWQVRWLRGVMHGSAQQFDEDGHVLYRSRFNQGTGIDLWVQGSEIVELRELEDNERHGLERWGHPRLPYEEAFYLRGRRAGVFRRWAGVDLEAGYPKFFVDDEEVSKNEYLRARRERAELPAYVPAENGRARPMLRVFKSIWLRKDVRAALVRTPSVDDAIGCGAHRRDPESAEDPEGPEPMK